MSSDIKMAVMKQRKSERRLSLSGKDFIRIIYIYMCIGAGSTVGVYISASIFRGSLQTFRSVRLALLLKVNFSHSALEWCMFVKS